MASHPAFQKLEDFAVHEYKFHGAIYEHKKSGAQVISIAAPDDNKVFAISFRTPPKDSTGVPHILEHSVLCGSRKYPVKEPFVDLLKGSLQNFLNAFTYPDRTCYPLATTNTKDFYNLINVYLDAVLHPRAVHDRQVFEQEGWHYELEDKASPLSVKGVVYNEMKGVYSSPDSLVSRTTQQALFPDNTYGVDSGGDPQEIVQLTFEDFQAFHRDFYHPSNARILMYGDDDLNTRLELLDDYLKDFSKRQVNSKVAFQQKRQTPLEKVTVPFPLSEGAEPKHIFTVNWLLNDHFLSVEEGLRLGMLDFLLWGTNTSPLRKALIDSHLGESVTGGGLSDELLQATFSVGLKGVQAQDVGKIEGIITSKLQELADQGFDWGDIDAALNTIEFRLREFNTGSFPRGLSVILSILSKWNYDQPPLEGISFSAPLEALKQQIKQERASQPAGSTRGGKAFQNMIKEFLLLNNHKVVVEGVPDANIQKQGEVAEEQKLTSIKAGMSEQQLEQIVKDTVSLREAQERVDSAEAKATLPLLSLEDLPPHPKPLPIVILKDEMTTGAGVGGDSYTLLSHPVASSGVLYVEVMIDMQHIDWEDVELLPLFTRLLRESGTASLDELALNRKILTDTGGVYVSLLTDGKGKSGFVGSPDEAMTYLVLGGKVTKDKTSVLFELINEILLAGNLQNSKRGTELLKESKARKEAGLLSSPHSLAAARVSPHASLLSYMNEVMSGLTSVRRAGGLVQEAEKDWALIGSRLERMRQRILQSAGEQYKQGTERKLVINLTGDEEVIQDALPQVESFVSTLRSSLSAHNTLPPSTSTLSSVWKQQIRPSLPPLRPREAFTIPSLVNYVAKGGTMYQPSEQVSGATSVVTRYLSSGFMWDQVRVLGGAYGGWFNFNDASGRAMFLSYRDPQLLNTLQVYDQAASFLQDQEVGSDDLRQSIIGSIGDIDSPLSPDQKGHASLMEFLRGESEDDRKAWREGVLKTSVSDFKEFAKRLGKVIGKDGQGRVVVFGSQQAIDKANAELPEDQKFHVEPALVSGKKAE
eukprot:gene30203-36483_t